MFKLFKRSHDPQEELQRLLGSYALPTFSAIAQRVLQEIRNPDHTSQSIARLLAADPGLSATLLKTVNSAAFGLRKRVDSVPQAVALMGSAALESLAVSVAVGGALPRDGAPEFEFHRFWLASARRAATARALAEILHPATAVQCYTAALLQDMAIPFLANRKADEYGPVLRHWHESTDDLAALERTEFGWDHAQVAQWIAERWELPDSLTTAVAAHHDPEAAADACPPAVALVSCLLERDDNPGTDRLIEVAHARHGIATDRLAELIQTSFASAESLARLLD
jgi:HD-like signal output (HDOD) protein